MRLLNDKRPTDGFYPVRRNDDAKPGPTGAVGAKSFNLPRLAPTAAGGLPIRVCDVSAMALTHHHPELKFTLEGEHQNLDEQIKTMAAKISSGNAKP